MPEAVTSTPAWAIRRLDADLRAAVDDVLDDLAPDPALNVRGYWLLEAIGPAPAHSQRELCDLLGIDRSDMVRLIDVLEDAGLVERVRDTEDRRRQLIGITAAGASLRDSLRAAIADATARVFADTPAAMLEGLAGALEAGVAKQDALDDATAADPAPAGDGDEPKKKSKKKRKNKKKGGKRQ